MALVEVVDHALHLVGELATDGNGEEQLDFRRRLRPDRGERGRKREQGGQTVSAHDVSYLIPENTKLPTMRRWNTRNSSSKGAATSAVPAATTPHWPPPSEAPAKLARPTVST